MTTIPSRCFTCGKHLDDYDIYHNKTVNEKKVPDQALDEMKMRRLCCRRMYLTHVYQLEQELLLYDYSKRVSEPYINLDVK